MPRLSKHALLGNTGSIFMLAVFTVLWSIFIPLAFGWAVIPIICFAIFAVYAVWLFIEAARTMRKIRALPQEPAAEADKRMGRTFGIIFGVEIVLIFVCTFLLGNSIVGNPNYITPVIALIVGLHCIPLGVLFHARLYYSLIKT